MIDVSQWDVCTGMVNDLPCRWVCVSEDDPEILGMASAYDDALEAFFEAVDNRTLH